MELTLTIITLFFCSGVHLKALVSALSSTWTCIDENGNSFEGGPICIATKVIAIKEVEAQIRSNATSCNKLNPISSSAGDDKCCLLNNINACTVGTLSPTVFQQYCSGRSDCMVLQNGSDPFGCNLTTHESKSLILDYSCIRRVNIKEMCKPWSLASTSDSIYMVNDNYFPIIGSTNESFRRVPVSNTGCSCSIEVDTCNINLTIFSVHVDFVSELGVCKQSMEFSDSEGNRQYLLGCGKKALEILYTTTLNYIKVQFHNSLAQDGGAFWIGVQGAAKDPFSTIFSCPASTQKYCRVSGTTTSNMPQKTTDLRSETTSSNVSQSNTDLLSGTTLSKRPNSNTDLLSGTTSSMMPQSNTNVLSTTSSKMPQSTKNWLLDENSKNRSGPEGLSSGSIIGLSIAAAIILLIAVIVLIAKLRYSRNKSNRKAKYKLDAKDGSVATRVKRMDSSL